MITRTLSKTIQEVSATFPVLLLTGPRQVGKTTLLAACDGGQRRYVTLDDLDQRHLARTDPALFFQTNQPPLIIDEVQYAPELFSYIKIIVDREKRNGLIWLTGSQKFHLMRGITESLAGRVAVLDLLGFSQREIRGRAETQKPFLPTGRWLDEAAEGAANFTVDNLFRHIWLGSFPALWNEPAPPRDIFYKSYLQTYIERDVGGLIRNGRELAFHSFIRATAARTGQLLNYADLARDVEVDQKTAKSWLSVLEGSGLISLLAPYHSNVSKRLIKTPKLYFLDTGLAAFLTGWDSPASLAAGAMNGAMLETFVMGEILKSYWHNGRYPNLYFYRDGDRREIDFLLESNMTLYPVEVKKSAAPARGSLKNFQALADLKKPVGPGAVICLREGRIPLTAEVTAVNFGFL